MAQCDLAADCYAPTSDCVIYQLMMIQLLWAVRLLSTRPPLHLCNVNNRHWRPAQVPLAAVMSAGMMIPFSPSSSSHLGTKREERNEEEKKLPAAQNARRQAHLSNAASMQLMTCCASLLTYPSARAVGWIKCDKSVARRLSLYPFEWIRTLY